MVSTARSREELLLRLVGLKSVTGSAQEADAALFIHDTLGELSCFKENPGSLELVKTPLEGDDRPLYTVAARVYANPPTKRTVVLIAHYDVVGASVYGELEPWAYNPQELLKKLAAADISPRAREDLESGGYIFGRGVMDMKCGLALEMELLRDFDADRSLFDVNIILLALPDEENTGCGMRGAASYLAELARREGLTYIGGIDTEPSDAGMPDAEGQVLFLGSVGKLLPAFYCVGVEAHVGNYYRGLSASLLSSLINVKAEASPLLADPDRGTCLPSWCCLSNRTLNDHYEVTVPRRSASYFNAYITKKGPQELLAEMLSIASQAMDEARSSLAASHEALVRLGYDAAAGDFSGAEVLSFAEVFRLAEAACGADEFRRRSAAALASTRGRDVRERGILLLEEATRMAALAPPFIAVGFLPPYLPPVSSRGRGAMERAALLVVEEAKRNWGIDMKIGEYFAGLCDLSYLGPSPEGGDEVLASNMPGWGELFSLPFGDIREIMMPVANLGPWGYDAHRMTERLERDYSLRVLPQLLAYFIRALSAEDGPA